MKMHYAVPRCRCGRHPLDCARCPRPPGIIRRILKWLASLAVAVTLSTAPAFAQSAPLKFNSAATNNATLVRAGRNMVTTLVGTNSTATAYYLKLYDKATAPTCGTDIPKTVVVVPPLGVGGTVSPELGPGLRFNLGLGFCLVAGIADADNTAAVTGLVVNFGAAGF